MHRLPLQQHRVQLDWDSILDSDRQKSGGGQKNGEDATTSLLAVKSSKINLKSREVSQIKIGEINGKNQTWPSMKNHHEKAPKCTFYK